MGFLIVHPWVKFEFQRSKWEWWDPTKKWTFDLPLLGWGELVVGYPREDEGLKKFAMKLLRLVNKVTWKRTGYGLDSCLWSQAGNNERRGLGAGHVFPSDETVVLNKYYDDTLWDDALPPATTRARASVCPCRGLWSSFTAAGNHFLTLVTGHEHLAAMGKLVLWEGAHLIVFAPA